MNGDRLRALLADGGSVLMAGVYDALTARLAVEAGFDVVFVSGYCTAATQLGLPDFGYLTQTEIADTARRVCRSVRGTAVVVDGDTGYGNPLNVIRTVELFEEAGAAGIFLEDQQWPKKCGHMAGKRIVPAEEWLAKLQAAVDIATVSSSWLAPTRGRSSGSTKPAGGPRRPPPSASTPSSSRRRSRPTTCARSRRPHPAAPGSPT